MFNVCGHDIFSINATKKGQFTLQRAMLRCVSNNQIINRLASELFFSILAHSVYKI